VLIHIFVLCFNLTLINDSFKTNSNSLHSKTLVVTFTVNTYIRRPSNFTIHFLKACEFIKDTEQLFFASTIICFHSHSREKGFLIISYILYMCCIMYISTKYVSIRISSKSMFISRINLSHFSRLRFIGINIKKKKLKIFLLKNFSRSFTNIVYSK
jgi:hypothetical protein